MTNVLELWVVYDHPTDFPDCWVARKFEIHPDESKPTKETIQRLSIKSLRDAMLDMALHVIPRSPGDDANIVEVWL